MCCAINELCAKFVFLTKLLMCSINIVPYKVLKVVKMYHGGRIDLRKIPDMFAPSWVEHSKFKDGNIVGKRKFSC